MIIVGHDQVFISCSDILPLAFISCEIFPFLPYFGVFWRSSGLSGGIMPICGPPGENKNYILIRLVMENNFHYDTMII